MFSAEENLHTLVALLCLAPAAVLAPDATAQQRATNVAAATSRVNTAPLWQPKVRRAHETEWQAVTLVTNPRLPPRPGGDKCLRGNRHFVESPRPAG